MRRRSGSPTSERSDLVLAVAVAICLASPAVRAQEAPARVVADVSDCVGVKSSEERLACFDRHVEAAKPNRDASPAPQQSAAAAPPAARTDTVAGTPTSTYAPAAQAPPEIVATVTELHETVPNAWLITLDNGQVWRQNTPQRFALKMGQRVTLRTSKWGTSYRLSADTLSGFIQVERVR